MIQILRLAALVDQDASTMETVDESATESDQLGSSDDNSDHETSATVLYDRSRPLSHAVSTSSSTSHSLDVAVTPWNNVLALARVAAPPSTTTAPSVPAAAAFQAFRSPFAVLQPNDMPQHCPRCSGRVDHASTGLDDHDATVPLVFCVCCKRSLPTSLLVTSDLPDWKRCAPCTEAARAMPELLDALVAELPGYVRIARDAGDVLRMQEAAVREYDALREADAKLHVEADARVREIHALDAALETAINAHMARRRAAFSNASTSTLEDARRLFEEWIALEKQRVSLTLQRLVVLDQFLASHFLPSPSTVTYFMQSLGLVPAEAYPMIREYDASEQCDECKILLTPPGPVVGSKNKAVVPGFCDCCKRMLPDKEFSRAPSRAKVSFCAACRRRRDFSLISDANLVGIPDLQWCQTLWVAVKQLGQTIKKEGPLAVALAGRLAEAEEDVARYKERVDGLAYHQHTVLRKGNTPMAISRHWYAEHAASCHGLVAALLKQLLLCTEAGAKCGRKMWQPILTIVQPSQSKLAIDLPEWLATFLTEQLKEPVAEPERDPAAAKPPRKSILPSQNVVKRSQTVVKSSQHVVKSSQNAVKISQTTVKISQPPSNGKAAPKPPSNATPALQPVSQTVTNDAHPSSSPAAKSQTSKPPTVKIHGHIEHTCRRCTQVVAIQPSGANVNPSYCDCCELVLPQLLIQTRMLHPQLCTSCIKEKAKLSPHDIQVLSKRPGDARVNGLLSLAGHLRHLITKSGTVPTRSNTGSDSRRRSAEQEVGRWKSARRQLRKRQTRELEAKEVRVRNLHALYVQQTELETAFVDSLLELVEVLHETINDLRIEMPTTLPETIATALRHDVPKAEGVVNKDHVTGKPTHACALEKNHTRERSRSPKGDPKQRDVGHRRSRSRSRRRPGNGRLDRERGRKRSHGRSRDDAHWRSRDLDGVNRNDRQRATRENYPREDSRRRSRSRERQRDYTSAEKRPRYHR